MKYLKLFSLYDLAILHDWLEQTGELFVDIYHPKGGGDSFKYLVKSIAELKQLIQKETWYEIEITIVRHKQFALRGIANKEMMEKAILEIQDGEYYSIISMKNSFPNSLDFLADGNSYAEIRRDFSEFSGQNIGFGKDPCDCFDDNWFKQNPDGFFRLKVFKNRIYHKKAAENPEKYKWLEDFWLE